MADLSKLRKLISETADAARGSIRAYHGSPYDFDRFDASKIGTGEGAQVYGHGLYFAGAEDTADTYRKSLSALRRTPHEDALEFWRRHTEEAGGNRAVGIGRALDWAIESRDEAAGIPEAESRWNKIINHLTNLDVEQPLPKRSGHMYEVELGVPEEALLDLDTPVVDQPRAIQDMLGSYGRAPSHFTFGQEGWRGSNALFRAKDNLGGSAADASRVLLERGIPGVRYLDQHSRAAGKGATRNYVMFPGTEDRIQILRKFGLLPPLMAPALMQDDQ
jgi:hypothetical protein